jgi:hypothetical protein
MKHRQQHGYAVKKSKKYRIYAMWLDMRNRCYRPGVHRYENYGGRGIKVCEAWKKSFIKFKNWVIEHGYKDNLSIDRINNNGDYTPNNCRFVTNKENCRNRSTTKMNIDKVLEIKRKFTNKRGDRTRLAKEYNISITHVSRILNGESWAS